MKNTYNFQELPPFQFYVLQNFPFIEQSFDALTNYELMCKLTEEMNKVINTTNLSGEQIQNLTNSFNDLYNYVNNFFETLDLQDEVNKKLDEMVEDGTIENLFANYSNIQKIYTTFSDLENDSSLIAGMNVKTLGYYTINDGGGASYKIVNGVDSNYIQTQIGSLYANLLIDNNTINFRQLGARPQTTLKIDNKPYLNKFLSFCNTNKKISKLYIPTGIWCFSEVIFPQITQGFIIYGDEALNLDYGISGTIITAFADNQNTVWSIGETSVNSCKSFTIKNLNFSSGQYDVETLKAPHLFKVGSALKIINSSFGILDNIGFVNIWGRALTISSTWEMYYKLLFFRHIDAQDVDGILVFDDMSELHTSDFSGVNASAFDNVMFEAFHGTPIYIKANSNFGNSSFKNINLEDFRYQNPDRQVLYHNIENPPMSYRDNSEFVVKSIIECENNCSMLPLFIANLELNNVAFRYYTDFTTQKNYIIDTVLHLGNNYRGNITFGNINCQGITKDLILLSNYPQNTIGKNVFLDFGTVNILGKANGMRAVYELQNFPEFNYSKSTLTPNFQNNNDFTRANQFKNVHKAIDFVYKRIDDSNGYIQTDLNASNPTKLVVNPANAYNNENTFLCFRKTGNTLYMNAKIPAGINYRIVINDLTSQSYTEWQGTGEYKLYSLDITNLNPEVVLRAITVPYDYDKSILIDYFYMI